MTKNFASRAFLALSAASIALGAGATAVTAQDDSPAVIEAIDIAKLTCRDLLKSPGDERDYFVLFILGYLHGVDGTTEVNIPRLAGDTDKAIDACIAKPSANLLEVFRTIRN
jgi:hypothetical protein